MAKCLVHIGVCRMLAIIIIIVAVVVIVFVYLYPCHATWYTRECTRALDLGEFWVFDLGDYLLGDSMCLWTSLC